jgi:uncharacterized protein (TIGR00369 family)
VTTTENRWPRQPLPTVDSAPERLFQVAAPIASDDGAVTTRMPTGAWLNGPTGRPLGGALGVLADNALGFALLLDRPADRWSVSSEISIDLCGMLPGDGSLLSATARTIHRDTAGGVSSGTVLDEQGRVVAVCRQHGRWVPHALLPVGGGLPNARTSDLMSLLGVRVKTTDDGAELECVATIDLVNPLGNLHGGIALCASDIAANAALIATGLTCDTASIHIAYVRPVPLGTVLTFEAAVVHAGRTFAVVSVAGKNESGKACTIATVTAAVRRSE